jgi:hypothetical protein
MFELSYLFPVHREGLPLLRRALLALARQTAPPEIFEAVVACDGFTLSADEERYIRDELGEHGGRFALTFVNSPRTRGNEDLPHRNHARNAASRASEGQILWFVDCDMLVDPRSTLHALSVLRGARHRVISPCFAEPACDPQRWLALPPAQTWRGTLRRKTASGLLEKYRPGTPELMRAPTLPEGFPALHRDIFDALGGFDERYLGWGGNKIDLTRRVRLMDTREHLLESCVLRSVLWLHQPHERDALHFDAALRDRNTERFLRMQREAEAGAEWWKAQVAGVQSALRSQVSA